MYSMPLYVLYSEIHNTLENIGLISKLRKSKIYTSVYVQREEILYLLTNYNKRGHIRCVRGPGGIPCRPDRTSKNQDQLRTGKTYYFLGAIEIGKPM